MLVSWFLFSEISNIFLSARSVCIKLNVTGVLNSVASIGFLLSFFAARIVPLPLLVYFLSVGNLVHLTPIHRTMAYATLPLPLLLNLHWFRLALLGALKFFAKDDKKAKKSS